MKKKTIAPIEPTTRELQAIESEALEPLTNEDIKYILENADGDTALDYFNPFDFDANFDFEDNF